MRELKFRVWDKKIKFFCPTKDLDRNFGLNFNGELCCLTSMRERDNFVIQQFTGRSDNNNRLIYEGDILKCVDRTYNKYVIVSYDTYRACFSFEYRSAEEFFEYNAVEIAGNIFENEDLLQNKI